MRFNPIFKTNPVNFIDLKRIAGEADSMQCGTHMTALLPSRSNTKRRIISYPNSASKVTIVALWLAFSWKRL